MACLAHDTPLLFCHPSDASKPLNQLHGRPLCDAAQDEKYCRWVDSLPNTSGVNRQLQAYFWAYPPVWRRHVANLSPPPAGARRVAMVLDTETTTLFDRADGGTGVTPVLASSPVHLLDIAWKIVDVETWDVLESAEWLCKPLYLVPDEQIYDKTLYADACQSGAALDVVMNAFTETVERWIANHAFCFVAHNVAFDRKVILTSLQRCRKERAYKTVLALPWVCSMLSVYYLEDGSFSEWAAAASEPSKQQRNQQNQKKTTTTKNPSPSPASDAAAVVVSAQRVYPRLQRLHAFCTQNDVTQLHRAMADVNLLMDCLPELVKRRWIVFPSQ